MRVIVTTKGARLVDYVRHARVGSLFYEDVATGAGDRSGYRVEPPTGFRMVPDPDWVFLTGDAPLPVQGWKIHVSTTLDEAPHVLAVVAAECFRRQTAFKHLPSREALREQSSKYADRGRSGKFITVYPTSDEDFVALLHSLGDLLDGMPGPSILSDVRWRNGPVHFRWGAFKRMETLSAQGDRVPAVVAPNGDLVPDEREATFRLPSFVEPPQEVRAVVTERLDPTDRASAELLDGRVVERALHFSNGGGVYLLGGGAHGTRIVMKEGRPDAALDGRGRSARERVEHEYAVLARLRRVGAVVTPLALRHAGEHAFLLEEHVPGSSLFDWVATHYPYSFLDDVADYERRAVELVGRVEAAVRAVHAEGVALMDLQPRNVLVDQDGAVRLVDLETACDVHEDGGAGIGTPGYVPPWRAAPLERDRYALAQTAMHVFQPLTPLNDLSDALWDSASAVVDRDFGESATGLLRRLRAESAAGGPEPAGEITPVGPLVIGSTRDLRSLAVSLREGCAQHRRDGRERAYPGDPAQFAAAGLWNVEHGLAGVMHALGDSDANADADLELLADGAGSVAEPVGGLLRGLLGVAVVLAGRGARAAAERAAERELAAPADPQDVSLRTGLAGRVMALRALRASVPTRALSAAYDGAVRDLRALLADPPSRIHSPGRSTDEPVGLFDGWSGPAVAAVRLAHDEGDPSWFDLARRAVGRDVRRLERARDGSLQVRDATRLMPYLADGSAGIGVALAQLPHRAEDDDVLARVGRACRVRCTSNAGLLHGRAGLLLALAAMPLSSVDGAAVPDVLHEQASRLPVHLFRRGDEPGVVAAGENALRLSLDLGTGSAGIATVLDLLAGDRAELLPAVPLTTPARRRAGEPRPEGRG